MNTILVTWVAHSFTDVLVTLTLLHCLDRGGWLWSRSSFWCFSNGRLANTNVRKMSARDATQSKFFEARCLHCRRYVRERQNFLLVGVARTVVCIMANTEPGFRPQENPMPLSSVQAFSNCCCHWRSCLLSWKGGRMTSNSSRTCFKLKNSIQSWGYGGSAASNTVQDHTVGFCF